MSTKLNNIITWFIITLVFLFIYFPLRNGKLEQQIIKKITTNTEKIIISVASFEKNKKLQDKDIPGLFQKIKQKYNPALITIADSDNKILKAGKDDRYIKSNKTFDSIINSFLKNEFTAGIKNDFLIRYYDQHRFYIFVRNITGGKVLIVFPYKLDLKLSIQLALEIILVLLLSLIITVLIFVKKNRKKEKYKKNIYKSIQKDKKTEQGEKGKNLHDRFDELKLEKLQFEQSDFSADSLNDDVYELFKYISEKYNPHKISIYLIESSCLKKIFELKGKAFIKINTPGNLIEIKQEIMEELKRSSIILTDKGKNVFTSILYQNNLIGAIEIARDKQFTGPEINDIKVHLDAIAEALNNYATAAGKTI